VVGVSENKVSVVFKMNNYGLNDSYDYYEIFLDSYDASLTSNGAFASTDAPLFRLNEPVTSIAAIKIIEVQVPFSFYVCNSSNNTFLLTDDLVTDAVVTITPGNYSSTTMATQLKTALELASPGRVYTVTYAGASASPNTGKFTVSNDAGGINTFTLTFGSATDLGATNPRYLLGMGPGANTSTTSQVLVAPNVAAISGPNYLYVNCRTFGPVVRSVLPDGAVSLGGGAHGPQIAKIPISVQPGGVIYWSDPDPQKWFSLDNLALLTQIDLYLTLGNNTMPAVAQLNGSSFSVKLGLLTNKSQIDNVQGRNLNTDVVMPR